MPAKNVQMNSDEEVLEEFDERYQMSETSWSFDTVNEIWEDDVNEIKNFLRSALSQARKDERKKCGREIVAEVEKMKVDCEPTGYEMPEDAGLAADQSRNEAVEQAQSIVSSLTGLNEK